LRIQFFTCVLFFPLVALGLDFSTATTSLIVNGYSRHFHVDDKYAHTTLNEKNYGLGLEFDYEQSPNDKLRYVNNLGWYKDSLNSTAYYAGGAAFYDVVGNKDLRFSVGGEITGFYSENYNKGKPFIALVPVANLGNSNYSVNFVLIPRFSQFMESGVAFFQFKMRVK